MRRIFLLCLICLLVASAITYAQTPPSLSQVAMASSPQFVSRVAYLMNKNAVDVLNEAHDASAGEPPMKWDTNCHALRAAYAKLVLADSMAAAWKAALSVSNVNESGVVLPGTLVPATVGPPATFADSSVDDTVLLSAVKWRWNALSGCDTGSAP